MDPRFIADSFIEKLTQQLPAGASKIGEEFREQLKKAATAVFKELDLVTRDEFDSQAAQLDRLSEQLARLEQQLEQLDH